MAEERTGGKVEVEIYFSGTLLSGTNTFEGITGGVCDVGTCNTSFRPERFPLMSLINIPHAYTHTMVPIMIAGDLIEKLKPPEFDGVHVLTISSCSVGIDGGGIICKYPIRGLDDLKGKEIRGTGVGVRALELLGATPLFLPMADVYEALSKGIVPPRLTKGVLRL